MNNFFKKVSKMMKYFNKFKNSKGNSLAEFAVTAAMMATLATTAAPRFSGVGDAGKANQTKANLDKIGSMVNQFYMNKSAPPSDTNPSGEGQGRLPGQPKYNLQVGGYTDLEQVYADIKPTTDQDGNITAPAIYNRWDGPGSKWRCIILHDDDGRRENRGQTKGIRSICSNCSYYGTSDHSLCFR